jgi:hypothetical protein
MIIDPLHEGTAAEISGLVYEIVDTNDAKLRTVIRGRFNCEP